MAKIQKTEKQLKEIIDAELAKRPEICPPSMDYEIERQDDGRSWKILTKSKHGIAYADCANLLGQIAVALKVKYELV